MVDLFFFVLGCWVEIVGYGLVVLDFFGVCLFGFDFVMLDWVIDDCYVVWYSEIYMLNGVLLEEVVVMLGWCDGDWFVYVYVYWRENGYVCFGYFLLYSFCF